VDGSAEDRKGKEKVEAGEQGSLYLKDVSPWRFSNFGSSKSIAGLKLQVKCSVDCSVAYTHGLNCNCDLQKAILTASVVDMISLRGAELNDGDGFRTGRFFTKLSSVTIILRFFSISSVCLKCCADNVLGIFYSKYLCHCCLLLLTCCHIHCLDLLLMSSA